MDGLKVARFYHKKFIAQGTFTVVYNDEKSFKFSTSAPTQVRICTLTSPNPFRVIFNVQSPVNYMIGEGYCDNSYDQLMTISYLTVQTGPGEEFIEPVEQPN